MGMAEEGRSQEVVTPEPRMQGLKILPFSWLFKKNIVVIFFLILPLFEIEDLPTFFIIKLATLCPNLKKSAYYFLRYNFFFEMLVKNLKTLANLFSNTSNIFKKS